MPRSISDPLPSWNDGTAKRAIMDFVRRVSTDDSRDYVPENERIAVFDNDGTLWCEMPVPVQAFFAADRLRALAPERARSPCRSPWQDGGTRRTPPAAGCGQRSRQWAWAGPIRNVPAAPGGDRHVLPWPLGQPR